MTKLFISDLHLHHTRPEVTGVFQEFIDELLALSTPNPELYILGDLFEFWTLKTIDKSGSIAKLNI